MFVLKYFCQISEIFRMRDHPWRREPTVPHPSIPRVATAIRSLIRPALLARGTAAALLARAPAAVPVAGAPGTYLPDGNSDPVGIVSMVGYVQRTLHASRHQVFATGISSGAMMTNVLLGDYPDVFAAGSAMSGVPFGCFATTDGSLWNNDCANGLVRKTPQQWGDLVRAAFPGYRGPRPRIQIWHGTADSILFYPNFGEEVKQWTNVLHARVTYVDHPQPTWTHTVYVNREGVAVDAYSVAGEDHNLGFHYPYWAPIAIQFFGLSGGGACR